MTGWISRGLKEDLEAAFSYKELLQAEQESGIAYEISM